MGETYTETDNVLSLLKQISKQQDSFQQQLQDLQVSYDKHERLMLKWVEQTQNNFSQEISALETSLFNLQESLTGSVRTCVQAECLDFQEKTLLMIETLYNHTLEKAAAGKADGFSKTIFGTTISGNKIVSAKNQVLEESDEDVWDTASSGDDDDNESKDFRKQAGVVPQSMMDVKNNQFKRGFPMTDLETLNNCKQIHYELNTFLVNVQKLLLRPINSQDISGFFIEGMKKLLQTERNFMADQLCNVHTAISSDVQARISKMEINVKQELQKVETNLINRLKVNKEMYSKVSNMHEDFKIFQNSISSDLPNIIASKIKLVKANENDTSSLLEERELRESGNQYDDKKRPIESRQSETEVKKERYLEPEGKKDSQAQSNPNMPSSDQVQTVTTKCPSVIPNAQEAEPKLNCSTSSTTCADLPSQTVPVLLDSASAPIDSSMESESNEHANSVHPRKVTNPLTDAHFRLMFGQYEEVSFPGHINCSKLAVEENTFPLSHIDPDYNLVLKAIEEDNTRNLQFFILAVSRPQDKNLIWPAVFNIKINLDDKHSLMGSENEVSFTKQRQLSKPRQETGESYAKPVCYFRKEIYKKFVHEDILHFTVSIRYTPYKE